MAKSFLIVLKFLMVLLAVVWVSIWVMKPTQIWTRKWKKAEDAAKTTVFGSNGNFLKLIEVINKLKLDTQMF